MGIARSRASFHPKRVFLCAGNTASKEKGRTSARQGMLYELDLNQPVKESRLADFHLTRLILTSTLMHYHYLFKGVDSI